MKRAILAVFAAALLVLLSYPSTQSLAASQANDITGPRILPEKDGDVISMTGDDDGGDADDILGINGRTGIKADSGTASSVQEGGFRTILRVWWNYLIFFR